VDRAQKIKYLECLNRLQEKDYDGTGGWVTCPTLLDPCGSDFRIMIWGILHFIRGN